MTCDPECQANLEKLANFVAGGCTIFTVSISLFQILKHLSHYTNPYFQRKIILIIFTAPFYSILSLCAIIFHDTMGYWALVRDIYDAFLIYSFFSLLALYLAYDAEKVTISRNSLVNLSKKDVDYDRIYQMLEVKGIKAHFFPFNFLCRPILLISKVRAEWYFKQSRLCILQYLAVKPIVTVLMIIDTYAHDNSDLKFGLKGIAVISELLSLYFMVLFYRILYKELAYTRPLLKFLSVKGIVFLILWQDVIVTGVKSKILENFGPLTGNSGDLIMSEFENILVCLEMVLLTIITIIAFSYKNFKESETLTEGFTKIGKNSSLGSKVTDAFHGSFVTAIKDLKHLKEPFNGSFNSFKDTNTQQTDMVTFSIKKETGLVSEEDLNHTNINIYEKPKVITGFIEADKSAIN